jgi:hypothetical protein
MLCQITIQPEFTAYRSQWLAMSESAAADESNGGDAGI